MKKFASALMMLVLLTGLSNAGSEYTYEGGIYWKDGLGYTRTQEAYSVPYASSYWNGYCWVSYTAYKTEYRYVYTPYKLPTPATPDWRSQLTAIAAARDKVEGKIRTLAAEQQNYEATLKSLGLEGNFRWQNYGINPYQAPLLNSSLQLSSAGVQGNTVYGYATATQNTQVGFTPIDPNQAIQAFARTVENAQTLAGQANTDLGGTVNKVVDGNTRFAESIAKGQAAALALKAAEASTTTKSETKTFTFKMGPGGQVTDVVPFQPNAKVSGADWIKQSGPQKCIACHTGAEAKGGFNVDKFSPSTATPEQIDSVLKYLTKKGGCPKNGSLTPTEMGQFLP